VHIHQVHFLTDAENEKPIGSPVWLITVTVPYGGSADLILDFTDPPIRGLSVFHCDLLHHEDQTMTAKILFE
jgi:suppressor of ftsI